MASQRVSVVGAGMMTAVGLSAPETAASVRARVARFAETEYRDRQFDRFTLAEVLEDGLPELVPNGSRAPTLTYREARMLRLGIMPLRECLAPLAGSAHAPGLLLALPEARGSRPDDRADFLSRLVQLVGGGVDLGRSDASFRERAGGLAAVGRAAEIILAGEARFMIAGGIDSYRDLLTLGQLDFRGRIKSPSVMDGFIPGEGAAFVLLASRDAAAAQGLTPLASVSPAATGYEEGHLSSEEPYRGDGLAATLEQLVQTGAAPAPIGEVYSSMNGESHWAKEWGVAFLRNRGAFAPDHGVHHPADSFGDVGAACGALLVALAALGVSGGYHRTPCLVYSSSDDGPRAALVVGAP
jgi:3-oxoacyl-[acyl-carrier-protein] synthase I